MDIRPAEKSDYHQLALMRWEHYGEDDLDYGENNLKGVCKEDFIRTFTSFLNENNEYKIFVADDGGVVASVMCVYMIPKLPKPNGQSHFIAYLTNVYTRKEYRSNGVGTRLLSYIKEYLAKEKCELIFVWPSDNSVKWYERNGFSDENEIFECGLTAE